MRLEPSEVSLLPTSGGAPCRPTPTTSDGSEGFDANYAKQVGSGRRAGHFKVPGVGKRQALLGVHTVGGASTSVEPILDSN